MFYYVNRKALAYDRSMFENKMPRAVRPGDLGVRGIRTHLSCPDRPGIVYAVSSFLVQHSGNIVSSQQYGEQPDGRFFMRVHFTVPPPGALPSATELDVLERDFSWVAESFHMTWRLHDAAVKVRTLIMVSRLGHCLNDLLFRWQSGTLPVDITGVVSNHRDFAPLTSSYGLPFRHVPVTAATKADAEAALLALIDSDEAELIVLARFLPSFKGAKPYHQAHTRGVKLVGATAHYVTPDLDEGPIIEQDVIRVDHALAPERLVEAGRDVEAQVLARAVTWHAEHRVLLNDNRTVVFHLWQ
jgi:formyltetrahydrofolate deformylase